MSDAKQSVLRKCTRCDHEGTLDETWRTKDGKEFVCGVCWNTSHKCFYCGHVGAATDPGWHLNPVDRWTCSQCRPKIKAGEVIDNTDALFECSRCGRRSNRAHWAGGVLVCAVCESYSLKPPPTLTTQVGGSHYKDMKIQPIEYIFANNLGFAEGCILKYISRWRSKGGVDDLRKAKHYIEMLIEAHLPTLGQEE